MFLDGMVVRKEDVLEAMGITRKGLSFINTCDGPHYSYGIKSESQQVPELSIYVVMEPARKAGYLKGAVNAVLGKERTDNFVVDSASVHAMYPTQRFAHIAQDDIDKRYSLKETGSFRNLREHPSWNEDMTIISRSFDPGEATLENILNSVSYLENALPGILRKKCMA